MKTLEQQQKDAFDAYLSAIRYGNESLVRATKRVLDDLTKQKNEKNYNFFSKSFKINGLQTQKNAESS